MSALRSYYTNYHPIIESIQSFAAHDKDPAAIAYKERSKKDLINWKLKPSRRKWPFIRDIEEEQASLSPADFVLFERIKLFAKFYFKGLLKPEEQKIIHYLEGTKPLGSIVINKENASQFLKIVKLIDLAISWQRRTSMTKLEFNTSSYDIRSKILESSSLTTCEAYTNTLDPKKLCDRSYLLNPQNYIPERIRVQAGIIANQWISLRALSMKLAQHPFKVIALKGNTGVGKSSVLEKYGIDSGILNPDTGKAVLKRDPAVSNQRVYDEWTNLFWYRFLKNVSDEHVDVNFVLDSRLIFVEDVETYVIEPAQKRKGTAEIIDVDAPLETSLARVLARDSHGEAPCVPLHVVVNGFMQTRKNRLRIIERIVNEPAVESYKLYSCKNGKQLLVAEKVDGVFKIIHAKAFAECVREPSPLEINQVVKRKITAKYIDQAIAKNIIFPSQKSLLARWKGMTFEKALELNS
jgi:hypothetical protein